ncbi:hypothetical protein KC851_01770 [Candidatus Kaiserbacteria bacterium]|nr:hypothetical protein [Candidatus Kaiserbacteria bacterium]
MFNEKENSGLAVQAVYEYTKDADALCRQAMEQIGAVATSLRYQGRVVVNITVIHPSFTVYGSNDVTEVGVHINFEDEMSTEDESQFALEFSLISNEYPEPDAMKLYNCGNTYSIIHPINSDFGNSDCCIVFCVWAPDKDADKFLGALIQSAEIIWSTFLGSPVSS